MGTKKKVSDEREIGISLDFEKFKQVLIKARINEKKWIRDLREHSRNKLIYFHGYNGERDLRTKYGS